VLNIGSNIGNVLSNNVIILSNTGNIYASNALQTTNVFANTINANTLNVTSLVVSGTITGTIATAGAVTGNAQTNITSVGTLTGLTVYGSVLSNVLNIGSNIGNVLSNNVIILSNTGNIYASNALQTMNVFANTINANTLNVTSLFVSGTITGTIATAGAVTGNAQANITRVGTLTGLTVYGSVLSNVLNIGSNIGNVLSNNVIILSNTGNIYASNALQTTNVFANTINSNTINVTSLFVNGIQIISSGGSSAVAGAVTGNAQTNITSVGTLTGLTVYGSVLSNVLNIGSNIGNVLSNNVIILSNTGNIYASNALQTTNIFANTINATNINTYSLTVSGPVTANVYFGPGNNLSNVQTNLVWSSPTSTTRNLTSFIDNNGTNSTIRTAAIIGSNLSLTLSSFTPILVTTGQTNLNWDVPASQFSVTVTNPSDVTNQFISNVTSLAGTATGTINGGTSMTNFSAPSASPTPAAGVAWSQTFTTTGTSSFLSNVTTNTTNQGGSVIGTVNFGYFLNGSFAGVYGTSNTFTTTWQNASQTTSTALTPAAKITYLNQYTAATYTLNGWKLGTPANASIDISAPQNGSATQSTPVTGALTTTINQTFTNAINSSNIGSTPTSLTLAISYTRPATVSGTSYTYVGPPNIVYPFGSATPTATSYFNFPAFLVQIGTSLGTPPTAGQIVSGTSYITNLVSDTGGSKYTYSNFPITPSGTQAFWLGLYSGFGTYTVFNQANSSGGSVNGIGGVTTQTIQLGPGNATFNMYGFLASANWWLTIS
jgi:hypothetical protein